MLRVWLCAMPLRQHSLDPPGTRSSWERRLSCHPTRRFDLKAAETVRESARPKQLFLDSHGSPRGVCPMLQEEHNIILQIAVVVASRGAGRRNARRLQDRALSLSVLIKQSSLNLSFKRRPPRSSACHVSCCCWTKSCITHYKEYTIIPIV